MLELVGKGIIMLGVEFCSINVVSLPLTSNYTCHSCGDGLWTQPVPAVFRWTDGDVGPAARERGALHRAAEGEWREREDDHRGREGDGGDHRPAPRAVVPRKPLPLRRTAGEPVPTGPGRYRRAGVCVCVCVSVFH